MSSKVFITWFWAASCYISEWAFSTIHHLCQRCHPVLSFQALVPLGLLVHYCCQCHCCLQHCCLGCQDDRCLQNIWVHLSHKHHFLRTAGWGHVPGVTGTSAMSKGCSVLGLCHWQWGASITGASMAGVVGLQAPLLLIPGLLWPQTTLKLESQCHVHHLPCCYQILWGCTLSHCRWGTVITGTSSTVHLVSPPVFVPVHTPLNEQIYGTVQCPCVFSKGTFAELWMFYWL